MPYTIVDLTRENGAFFGDTRDASITLTVPSNGDGFGFSVATGDFNGDGLDDIVSSSPLADSFLIGDDTGYVDILFGKVFVDDPAGGLIEADGDPSANYLRGAEGEGRFGFDIANAGDFNGDGIDDLLIGAPGSGPDDQGAAYLLFGHADLLDNLGKGIDELLPDEGFVITGGDAGGQLGYSVSSAGDFNQDGFFDIMVSAPFAGTADDEEGEIYVILGRSGTDVADMVAGSIAPADGFTVFGAASGDRAGEALAGSPTGHGFINNDSFPDIVIGSPGSDINTTGAGAVHVIYGRPTAQLGNLDLDGLPQADGWTILGDLSGDNAGTAVAIIEEQGGGAQKSIDSIAIGAPGADDKGVETGIGYVVSGFDAPSRALFRLEDYDSVEDVDIVVVLGAAGGARFGASVAMFFENEALTTASAMESGVLFGAPGEGRVYGLYPEAIDMLSGEFIDTQEIHSDLGVIFQGSADESFGLSVTGGRFDWDGDGLGDFLTGEPLHPLEDERPGEAHLILGREDFYRGQEFVLIPTGDASAEIGGNGRVIGTDEAQLVRIGDEPGNITFDPSFNDGGDQIVLPNNAETWWVRQVQSSVEFFDGEISVTVPVGPNEIIISFDDGNLGLGIDVEQKAIFLNDQEVEEDDRQIDAMLDPVGTLANAPVETRLLLQPEVDVIVGGSDIKITGTNSDETVRLSGGFDFRFDPSFNRGGDTIVFPGDADEYGALFENNEVLVSSDADSFLAAFLPVGPTGMTLSFDDMDMTLFYDTVDMQVKIDDLVLTGSTQSL